MNKQMEKPLVSVIIPVFNGASFLVEAISSAQKSTFKDFEVILIDDGSTDQSKQICKMLEKEYKNVRFYSFAKNKGLGRVLNFALKKAKGEYICRLNQDDRMLPFRLGTQVDFLKAHPEVVAVGSWIELFDEKNKSTILKFLPTDAEIKKVWHIVGPFSDPSVLYRKKIALQVGGYKQEYWPADDTHLWYRMGKKGQLANIQKPLVEVRWHSKAASIYYFRKLAASTYKMHRFAHKHIGKAPIYIQAYWLIQLACGMLLPSRFNWAVYRIMKQFINRDTNPSFSLPIAYQPITILKRIR